MSDEELQNEDVAEQESNEQEAKNTDENLAEQETENIEANEDSNSDITSESDDIEAQGNSSEDENDDEDFDEEEEARGNKRYKKSGVASAKEFFNTEVLYRFDIIEPEELGPLKGIYKLDLGQEGEWLLEIDQDLEINKSSKDPEVTLEIDSRDFLEIVNGKLNPQLALLSKKIKVDGSMDKAIKIQDILAPRSQ